MRTEIVKNQLCLTSCSSILRQGLDLNFNFSPDIKIYAITNPIPLGPFTLSLPARTPSPSPLINIAFPLSPSCSIFEHRYRQDSSTHKFGK